MVKAILLLKSREVVGGGFVERVVWRLPASVPGSAHGLKYRLAFVVGGHCVVRYDNEAGKGDHRHIGAAEVPYRFTDLAALLADFWRDVDNWGPE